MDFVTVNADALAVADIFTSIHFSQTSSRTSMLSAWFKFYNFVYLYCIYHKKCFHQVNNWILYIRSTFLLPICSVCFLCLERALFCLRFETDAGFYFDWRSIFWQYPIENVEFFFISWKSFIFVVKIFAN